MIYSKEAYDIDLNALLPEVEKIILSHELSKDLQVSKEEYLERILFSSNFLKELRGYSNEPYFIINDTEPAYDFWLAFYLSTKKPHQIKLVLDQHIKSSSDQALFVNHVEHYVLRIIEKNIFYNVDNQLKEISNWIREKRKEYEERNKQNVQNIIFNINYQQINLIQLIYNFWSHENETQNYDKKDTLVDSPYFELFLNELLVFCEVDSHDNLKKVFMKEKIQSKVIFKSNFLKISIIRPMKELISRGFIKMTQKRAASWLSENFEIRTENGTTNFSLSSTVKRFSEVNNERENSQIKYEHWFKK